MSERTEKKKAYVRRKCIQYLRLAKSIPGARDLATLDGFSVGTQVWLGALAELLEQERVERLHKMEKSIDH